MGQRTRFTRCQCWPNVMYPTQLSHVKTSHRCTLAQRWANILIPTSYRSDCKWQNINVGQCCANVVLPTPTIGQPYYPMPTLAQHSHAIWGLGYTSYFPLRQTWRFHFPWIIRQNYCSWVEKFNLRPRMAFSSLRQTGLVPLTSVII